MTTSGPRLPLRLIPEDKLQAAWRAGRAFYADAYERREPRALAADKPVEDMTLDELIATQDNEPLTESRRMFLHLGPQAKVMSLDAPPNGTMKTPLLEFIADDGPRCLYDRVDLEIDEDEAEDLVPIDKYFTPYDLQGIIDARQVEWEKRQAYSSATAHFRLVANDAGRLAVQPVARVYGNVAELARKAVSAIFDAVGRVETLDALHERLALIADVMDDPHLARHHSADPYEERERYLADADRGARFGIEHSSYEEIVLDPETGEETRLIHHRSPRHSNWELWHNSLRQDSSDPGELGTYLISNASLESLLGITEWDENGNPLNDARSALLSDKA